MKLLYFIRNTFLIFFLFFLLQVNQKVYAAENTYIDDIIQKGYLNVGLPPYTTPPFYYLDPKDKKLKGYDVDIIEGFAKEIGVDVVFDRDSTSFNNLVKRAGAGDFDMAIGKLGTTFKRMSDAHPHEYMNFRHALLSNRKFVNSLGVSPDNPKYGNELLNSSMKIGFIDRSAYDTYANSLFANAEKVGFKNWSDCKNALLDGKVDAIYRDATEIKKIVYQKPNLSIEYVPILFDDIIDQKSIFLSTEANTYLSDILDYYLKRKEIKTDSQIMKDYSSFYEPIN